MVKYVYIMGRGHSGSTVLECLLDNAEGVQGVGEAVVGLREDFCSIGEGGRGERLSHFWGRVKELHNKKYGSQEWAHDVDRFRSQAHISNFLNTLLAGRESDAVLDVKKSIERIYETILQVSGEAMLVDSSKEATRGLFIARHIESSCIIHLVRDPVHVLSSDLDRIKKGKFRFLRRSYDTQRAEPLFAVFTCINWIIGNLLCEIVKMQCKEHFVTVRYEDLQVDPQSVLSRIGERIGIDVERVAEKVKNKVPMSTGVGLSGNRMRRGEDEFVFRQGKYQKDIPWYYEGICKTITYPLRRRYGYIDG